MNIGTKPEAADMRYMVDGKECTAAQYAAAAPGKCKGVSTCDSDAEIAARAAAEALKAKCASCGKVI